MKFIKYLAPFISLIIFLLLTGCAPQNRLGMISDTETGLQYGSIIEKSFFIDSSQFENNKIKISARNVSGDGNYNIRSFINTLEKSFVEKGYKLGSQEDFGIKFDIIIEYSGHVQKNMSAQFGFLGAAVGGIGGYRSEAKAGEAIGILAGATVGAIAGSYITEDTYIIITRVSIGVVDSVTKHKKVVTFDSSPKLQEEEHSSIKAFEQVMTTKVAVFAGGRNVKQTEIIQGVKRRLQSILSDII